MAAGGASGGSGGSTSTVVAAGHYYVSPDGTGNSCTKDAPCSITQAQTTVRAAAGSASGDLVVELADGIYRLQAPLTFTANDSGTSGHPIVWQAASGAHPVISGAKKLTGWAVSDSGKNIWKASAPGTFASRQLFIDNKLATRARQQINRGDMHFSGTGFSFSNASLNFLNSLAHPEKTELRAIGSFTDRYSPVQAISNNTATMTQPAWKYNNFGWDTLQSPFRGANVYIYNAFEFLDQPGEWFLDQTAGALYYIPKTGQDMTKVDVELPQLELLVAIGGSYDKPVHDITFQGITFSHTSWLHPNTTDGYVCQQTGAFIVDAEGPYAEFEAARPHWHQTPGAVQVSAAKNIAFMRDRFVALGQVGLGIGNDDNAHSTGVGLGVDTISVTGCVFSDLASGSMVIGGIKATAHHPCGDATCGPTDQGARMIVQNVTVTDNLIHDIGIDYQDAAGLLFTYTKNVVVSHNEIYNTSYSGLCSGYGWGSNDAGGSPDYQNRGLYKYQPKYTTATIASNNRMEANDLHDINLQMNDSGCHYNLSANPGTIFTKNHCSKLTNASCEYEDEGSRYLTISDNVYEGGGFACNASTANFGDLTITGNWYSGGLGCGGTNNKISGNTSFGGGNLPAGAKAIVDAAGLEAAYADLKTNP